MEGGEPSELTSVMTPENVSDAPGNFHLSTSMRPPTTASPSESYTSLIPFMRPGASRQDIWSGSRRSSRRWHSIHPSSAHNSSGFRLERLYLTLQLLFTRFSLPHRICRTRTSSKRPGCQSRKMGRFRSPDGWCAAKAWSNLAQWAAPPATRASSRMGRSCRAGRETIPMITRAPCFCKPRPR